MSVAAPASAAGDEAELVVTVFDPNGVLLPDLGETFTASKLANDVTQDVLTQVYQGPTRPTEPLSGPSVVSVIRAMGLPPDVVKTIDFFCPGFGTPAELSAAAGDLADNLAPGSPFVGGYAPTFGLHPDVHQSTFDFAVQQRLPGSEDPSLSSAQNGFTSPGITTAMRMMLHLNSHPLPTRISASPATVAEGGMVTLAGAADGSLQGTTWTWHFDDGTPDVTTRTTTSTASSVTHRYAHAGTYDARVSVVDGTGSQGQSAKSTIRVTGGSTSRNTTGSGHGTATSSAPNHGPDTGTGPLAGGVPTSRTGPTGAGASFDPRSSGAPTGSTGAKPLPGTAISGFALSAPSIAAAATQAGATPRNDAAAAERAGSTTNRLGAWMLGGLAVVVLLGVGVLSERRRPRHRGRPPA